MFRSVRKLETCSTQRQPIIPCLPQAVNDNGFKTIQTAQQWAPQDTEEMALIGDPICTNTLSNH
jgi:hypothetical protein